MEPWGRCRFAGALRTNRCCGRLAELLLRELGRLLLRELGRAKIRVTAKGAQPPWNPGVAAALRVRSCGAVGYQVAVREGASGLSSPVHGDCLLRQRALAGLFMRV